MDVVGIKFKLTESEFLELRKYISAGPIYVSIKYSQSPEFKGRREVYIGGKHVGCLSQKSASADVFAKMLEGSEITLTEYQIAGLFHYDRFNDVCSRYISFNLVKK